jgi:hypothetical protein
MDLMQKRLSIVLVILAATLLPREYSKAGGIAERRVAAVHVKQFAGPNALRSISREAQVPIGFKGVVDYKTERTISLDFRGGSIGELLDYFVSQAPGYAWEEGEGIIHVSRSSDAPSVASVVISNSNVQTRTRQEIWDELDARPEIKTWLAENHCTLNEVFNGAPFRTHNTPITISAGTMTLSELLDQVALKSGENYWAIVQSPAGQECRTSIAVW